MIMILFCCHKDTRVEGGSSLNSEYIVRWWAQEDSTTVENRAKA